MRYFSSCHRVQILDWSPEFCRSADFIGQNEKKLKKSASKNKHPIKLHFFIWALQSAKPDKKVIPENQGFRSCPLLIYSSESWKFILFKFYHVRVGARLRQFYFEYLKFTRNPKIEKVSEKLILAGALWNLKSMNSQLSLEKIIKFG